MFFLPHLQTPHMTDDSAGATAGPLRRMKYVAEGVRWREREGEKEERMEEGKEKGKEEKGEGKGVGSALGPDWHTGRTMRGSRKEVQCPEGGGRGEWEARDLSRSLSPGLSSCPRGVSV